MSRRAARSFFPGRLALSYTAVGARTTWRLAKERAAKNAVAAPFLTLDLRENSLLVDGVAFQLERAGAMLVARHAPVLTERWRASQVRVTRAGTPLSADHPLSIALSNLRRRATRAKLVIAVPHLEILK